MEQLAKRTAGTPLSEAELEQRRNAARARWAAAGVGGAAAAAAGALTVKRKIAQTRAADLAAVRSTRRAAFQAATTKTAQRLTRHELAQHLVMENLQPSGTAVFLRQAIKTSGARLRQADTEVRRFLDEHAVTRTLPDGAEERLLPPQSGFSTLRDYRDRMRERLEDLKANGRPSSRRHVEESVAHSVPAHTRPTRGKRVAVWEAGADAKLAQLAEQLQLPAPEPRVTGRLGAAGKRGVKATLGFHREQVQHMLDGSEHHQGAAEKDVRALLRRHNGLDRIESLVRKLPAKEQGAFLEAHLLPQMKYIRPLHDVEVAAVPERVTPAHGVPVDGYPDRKTRASLARTLRDDVESRAKAWRAAEIERGAGRLKDARLLARQQALPAMRRLAALRNAKLRFGAVGAGALAAGAIGAVGSYFGAKLLGKAAPSARAEAAPSARAEAAPVESKLRKAASDDPIDAADAAESAISRKLATMFGKWTDEAEEKILQPSATTMHGDMQDDLDAALKPLDGAVRAGVDAGGNSIAFSFLARSPAVTAYIDRYRTDRVQQLADEQRDTIKAQLIDAARTGASPQQMAQRIKHTIGLTPYQAGHVVNYIHELETLNPGALQRELRDRRFDKTIGRAMETGEVLSADQIQKFADAYHRRYLAYRATTIARTEGVGGANNGQAASAAILADSNPDMDIEKTWIARQDERTRHDHHELHGQTVVGLETPFVCESGDEIRWPHDPNAPARQVINCRCTWATRLVPRVAAAES